jgi:hypothetical protein
LMIISDLSLPSSGARSGFGGPGVKEDRLDHVVNQLCCVVTVVLVKLGLGRARARTSGFF